jgi:hypothetical protein
MASKIQIDSQHFGFRNQLFRFNNSQTNASLIEKGQLIIVLTKDGQSQGLQVNSLDKSIYPPIYSCTPASVDPMSMTALTYGAKYVCELDTGRDDDLVTV